MVEIRNEAQKEKYFAENHFLDFFSIDMKPFVKIIHYDPDEAILQEGTESHFLLYLIGGRAKVFLTHENGTVSITSFLSAPCFIGEMELLEAQQFAKGVKAITACTCFAIPYNPCKEELLKDPLFLKHLCIFLGKKAVHNTTQYSHNLAYPLDIRLAEFILETSHDLYYKEKHTEASEYLGVTYRHLLYVIADFVKKGILKKTSKGYFIEDINKLNEIVNRK